MEAKLTATIRSLAQMPERADAGRQRICSRSRAIDMQPETKRDIVILLVRVVVRLYAIAGIMASRRAWNAAERATALVRVLEMLKHAYDQLAPLPDCAASVFEQYMVVRSVQTSALDDVQAAMALTRAGLVINTWCTASTMMVSTQATDGPLTIGGLMQTLGTLQPDPRYQAAVAEQLAAVAYDNSAARQLGNCYFQAYEGFSLLELHRLLSMDDTSHAADLLDNAAQGAQTAIRFLEREPLDQAQADENNGAQADENNGAQADENDHGQADDCDENDSDQAVDTDDVTDQPDDNERMDAVMAGSHDASIKDETENAGNGQSPARLMRARDPPASMLARSGQRDLDRRAHESRSPKTRSKPRATPWIRMIRQQTTDSTSDITTGR